MFADNNPHCCVSYSNHFIYLWHYLNIIIATMSVFGAAEDAKGNTQSNTKSNTWQQATQQNYSSTHRKRNNSSCFTRFRAIISCASMMSSSSSS